MSNKIVFKRSAVAGKIPALGDLALGEIALNTYDGKAYIKQDNGTQSIIQLGGSAAADLGVTSDTFVGTGSQTLFTLSRSPTTAEYTFITINGLIQESSTYSVSNTLLTFSVAPDLADSIEVRILYGNSASISLRDYKKYIFNITTTTTTVSGTDNNGLTLTYDSGYADVYQNGIRLVDGDDFVANTGTSIVLTSAAVNTDTIEVLSYGRAYLMDNSSEAAFLAANSASLYANTGINNAASASLYANTGINNAASASLYANTGIANAGSAALFANNALTYLSANTSIIAGIDLTQNTNISTAIANAASASLYANTGITNADSASAYANTGINNAASASLYANTGIANAVSASLYANTGINNADSASAYANTGINNAISASLYANTGIANAVSASLYANTGINNAASASAYANTGINNAISASDYANTGINNAASASLYANTKVSKSGDTITGPIIISDTGSGALQVAGTVTISQDLNVSGNIFLGGSATTISSNNTVISDPLIYLADGNIANTADIGIVGNVTNGHYYHTGLVRDHLDGTWKFFSNVTSEPTTTVNFGEANTVYDVIRVGGIVSPSALINGRELGAYTQLAYDTANTGISNASSASLYANTGINNAASASSYANTGINNAASASAYANTAINTIPSQTGNSGNILTTNGTTTSWSSVNADPMGTAIAMAIALG